MSIIYCHKHDQHFDSDYDTDCSVCEEECEVCEGEGEVARDVFDPDSGQYMPGVGTSVCICQLN